MNVIEIYKGLPKRNCGDCPQKTCMSFALALTKGQSDPEDCPYIDDRDRLKLKEAKGEDWRDTLINTLREDIKHIVYKDIYTHLGAGFIEGSLKIKCLGTDYIISPDGDIRTDGYINPWIRILLLHYIRNRGMGEPSGNWVSFSELKSGMLKSSSFSRDCEEPLKELLDTDMERTGIMLRRIGAREVDYVSSDAAWHLYALPKIPVMILCWKGDPDEEGINASALKILFDITADRFLDVESLIFLIEGLIHILRSSH